MLNKNSTITRSLVLTILTTALISPGAWGQTFKVLHSFGDSGDGRWPEGARYWMARGTFMELPKLVRREMDVWATMDAVRCTNCGRIPTAPGRRQ